ncbi:MULTISPECIES: energy transducer TonB [unclassified Tenacibaculum]|uniref:energy transducer TonB n=1 Tax=unclassified Tenacibaculum TaxID=2635139 RepID=UPI001F3187E8|nr:MULTISPECIES: energy transducer TonB [unclassified Tenacibaculum]MCF2874436.1 energy transducer TonB [Tenacibaculum sp. Cn5-1]MCF2935017.1 energy transducer TonB [Tenacibaculum sp. Cn5-34]MCG7511227.1 energy transducer TonB [Tenacibaculum sp. Cn5-46]
MKKFPLLVAAMLVSTMAVSQQEKCDTPDDSIADPNSITKCAIEDTKDGNKKQLSISVSTRRRVVRKNKEAVSAVGINSSQKVADIKKNSLLIGKLELDDSSSNIERIPFNLVEEIPLFSKCNNVPLIKQAKCFETQMSKHIMKNFKYPQEAIQNGIQGRVLVQFTINETGNVESIQMRGPKGGEILENEASRIISKLPKFIPGKHNGKNVKVKYGVPITFKGNNSTDNTGAVAAKKVVKKAPAKKVNTVKEPLITDFVKFAEVQSIPQFKACLKVSDMQKINCFNQRMVSHIQRNFNYPDAAAAQNIEGRVWVRFIIDKDGKVTNIRMKGPKNGHLLEQEAKRMVSKLPTFVPGKQNGKLANVEYYIPVNFTLN